MRVALAICSAGRPDALALLLPWIARQDTPPSDVLFVTPGPADLPDLTSLPSARVLHAGPGLPRQRNRALDALRGHDAVVFIDDDYWPALSFLRGVRAGLTVWPRAAGLTGRLLADGVGQGGLPPARAATLIARHDAAPNRRPRALGRGLVGLYGCNMALRMVAVGDLRFDEALPLYAWQEDVDLTARLPGEKLRTDAFAGVHLGTRRGRDTQGHRLGYSQVANPLYLMRKGSLPRGFALRLMVRTLAANHLRAAHPEPWIDRAARARGNRAALRDALRGRCTPGRILEMA